MDTKRVQYEIPGIAAAVVFPVALCRDSVIIGKGVLGESDELCSISGMFCSSRGSSCITIFKNLRDRLGEK